MRKNLFSIILTFCVLAMLLPANVLANTDLPAIDESAISKLREKMIFEELSQDKQDLIIKKIKTGEMLDCNNPKKVNLIPEHFFTFKNGETEKKYTFPDGTYIKMSAIRVVEENRQQLLDVIGNEDKVNELFVNQLKGVEPLTSGIGSGYVRIWLQMDAYLSGGGFEAYMYLDSSPTGYSSEFLDIYAERAWCTPLMGYTTNYSKDIIKAQTGMGQPAHAYFSWTHIFEPLYIQQNYTLHAYIESELYYTDLAY